MRSKRSDASPSLARRVAVASAGAALLGGIVAAAGAGFATEGLLDARDDDQLRHAARELAAELVDELREDGGATEAWQEALLDELEDVELPGARAAVHLGGARVAGDPALVPRAPGGCSIVALPDGDHRVCSVQHGEATVTLAARAVDAAGQRRLFAWAALIGVLFGAAAGGGASALVARWALAPLRRLRDRVRQIAPDAPRVAPIAEPLSYAEVEDLRLALAELVERLSASLAQAQRFAMDAAHELRTPLTTLSGELELLSEQPGTLDHQSLAPLRTEVERLVALVERLLALATPATDLGAASEVIDLEEVVRALAAPMSSRITIEAEPEVLVRGDATLLRIALQNGIDNALKFSEGPVNVKVWSEGPSALVDINDQGPGMTSEERARVFEPFYRTPAARAGVAGHGIGLALVAHVAKGLDGQVELADVARGTCLRLRLPRLQATP